MTKRETIGRREEGGKQTCSVCDVTRRSAHFLLFTRDFAFLPEVHEGVEAPRPGGGASPPPVGLKLKSVLPEGARPNKEAVDVGAALPNENEPV